MESLESIEEEYEGEMKHFEHILVDSESFAMCQWIRLPRKSSEQTSAYVWILRGI